MMPADGIPAQRSVLAIVLMAGAGALVAVTSLIAKALGVGVGGEPLHPLQISAGRFGFAFLAISTFALFARPGFHGALWGSHLARSASGWLGVTCMFAAASRMPLADATAITFLNPLVTMGLAILLLGESIGPRRLAAAGLALFGAMVLIRPGTDAFQPAALIALAAAVLMGVEAVIIKRLTNAGEPPVRILLINNGMGAIIAITAASFVWVPPSAEQWRLLACLGFAMICAQSLFIQAMKRGQASHVMPAIYSTLVFAALYDFGVFGVLPDLVAILGAAMVVAGIVLLAILRERAAASKVAGSELP